MIISKVLDLGQYIWVDITQKVRAISHRRRNDSGQGGAPLVNGIHIQALSQYFAQPGEGGAVGAISHKNTALLTKKVGFFANFLVFKTFVFKKFGNFFSKNGNFNTLLNIVFISVANLRVVIFVFGGGKQATFGYGGGDIDPVCPPPPTPGSANR